MINVVATQQGYYGRFRNPGEQFLITSAKQFSREWMRPKDKSDVAKLKSGLAKLEKELEELKNEVPEEDDFGLSQAETQVEKIDELDNMDKEELIAYGKANCIGLTLTRSMRKSTIRDRIRAYAPA